jgi:hypothetical protein
MKRARASKARQRLREAEQARSGFVEQLLGSDVMVEGSFVTLERKCGKPNCHCATGEKHIGKFLSRSEGGRTRLFYVPASDELDVSTRAESYRRFRRARAELMKLAQLSARIADELQEALTQPYPPESPSRRPQAPQRRRRSSRARGRSS